MTTESGLRELARFGERAAGDDLRIEEVRGRLIGPLRVGSVRYRSADLEVGLRSLEIDWRPAALLRGRLIVEQLSAAELKVLSRASDEASAPPTLPENLDLPLRVELQRVTLGQVAVSLLPAGEMLVEDEDAAFVAREVEFSLASEAGRHTLRRLVAGLPFGELVLEGGIDASAPFALALKGSLAGRFDPAQLGADVPAEAATQPPTEAAAEGTELDYRLDLEGSGVLTEPEVVLSAVAAGANGTARILLAPLASVPLRALDLDVRGLDPARFHAAAPSAELSIEARLAEVGEGALVLQGPLRIDNARPAGVDAGGLPVHSLASGLNWSEGGVRLDELKIELAGAGTVAGELAWEPTPVSPADPAAELQPPPADVLVVPDFGRLVLRLVLDGVDPGLIDARLPRRTVGGTVAADADRLRQHVAVDLRSAETTLKARGELRTPVTTEGGPVPGFTLDARVRQLDPRDFFPTAPQARLNLDFDAEGALAPVRNAALRFNIQDSVFERQALAGEGRLKLTGERLSDVLLSLRIAGNRVDAKGDWGEVEDRLRLAVDAPALAAIGFGLGGRLKADAEVSGGLAAPAGVLSFAGEQIVLPGGLRIAGVNGEGRLAAGFAGPFTLAVGLSGVRTAGAERDRVDSARLSIDGRRDQHRAVLSVSGVEEKGQQDRIELALEGGLQSGEELRWQGRLVSLETFGRFAARLRAPADLTLASSEIRLGGAELGAGEHGRIRFLETLWTPARSALRGELTGLVLGPVTRAGGRVRRGPGPLVLGAEWDLTMTDVIDGELRVYRESGDLTVGGDMSTRLGLEALEANLVARANRLAVSFSARGVELGEASGSATAMAARGEGGSWSLDPAAPLLGSARLVMPSIAWMGRMMEESVETGGRLEAEFSVSGTAAEPLAQGRIEGSALEVALLDQGLVLRGGELVADFDRDRLRLSRLHFDSPNRVRPRDGRVPFAELTATPGSLEASGEIALDSGEGRFEFVADRLPLLQREDRWLVLSGEGRARSGWTSLDLTADMRVDAGFIAVDDTPPPSLSGDVVVLGRDEPEAGNFALTMRLGIRLGEALYLSAMGVDTRLAVALELRLAPGMPLSAAGTVSTVGGYYQGYGQRLAIERGLISFQGALDNPALNIIALRKGLEVEAGVAITGSARRPQVRLVSEPGVPDPEKLSWIVLGRAPDAGGGADLALLLPAAQALLGGPGGGMTEELSRSLGFDTFTIGQGDLNSASRTATSRVVGGGSRVSGGPTVASQVLSVGKRLSSDLFLSFEQSLGGAESLVKLTYQLSRRVSMVARGGTDNALDLYYTFSFR